MQKRVAILVQPSRGYGRGVLSGIVNYLSSNRGWIVFHDERRYSTDVPAWLRAWRGDGVITSVESEQAAEFLIDRGIPTVDLHGCFGRDRFAGVGCDDRQAVELAFDHLRSFGLDRFAFCGLAGVTYSERREAFVREIAEAAGVRLDVRCSDYRHDTLLSGYEADASLDQEETIDWLKGLPKPIGVIACNDIRGIQVLNAAREAAISVPEEMAVVGFDNDALICEMATPPLSSVDLDAVRIGYTAARALDALMRGEPPALERTAPGNVAPRQSTDLLAIADPDMAEVLRYIEEHACELLSVEQIVEAAAVSRSTLERRFTKAVGRSLKQHITRVRIGRIKRSLTETDDKLDAIARRTGFSHAEYMSSLFKKQVGVTPGVYRQEHRRRHDDV